MNKILKFLIFTISTGIIMFGTWYMVKAPRVDPTLESLLSMKSIANNTKDILNETGVKGAEDVNYEVGDKNITFHYGKHKFDVAKEDVMSSEFQEKFKKLNLSVVMSKDNKLLVKYNDIRVKEIVN